MRTAITQTCLGVICLFAAAQAGGEDFRVESTVFSGKQKEPVSQSTTLFHAGVVYDYLTNPPTTAILDKPHGRFILLDIDRHERTQITIDEVSAGAKQLQSLAVKSNKEFLRFAANPTFDPTVDEKSDDLVFDSSVLTYRVRPKACPNPEAAEQYRDFSDWYMRLSALMNPAKMPPFARMAVNEELAKRGQVPESVSLNVPKQIALGGYGMSLRSEHIVTWRLLQKDLDEIAQTGSQMSSFKEVSFADYRKNQPK